MSIKRLEESIRNAKAIVTKAGDKDQKELTLLINDLEEARLTIFVKTADAKPFLERCHETSGKLKAVVEDQNSWNEETKKAFSAFERAVSKLRNTILVRTQKAT
jgi:hypothetical protein